MTHPALGASLRKGSSPLTSSAAKWSSPESAQNFSRMASENRSSWANPERADGAVDSPLIVADDRPQAGRGEPVNGIHHPQNYSEGQSAAMAVNEKQDADAEYAGAFGQSRPFRQLAGMKRLTVLFFVIGEVCRPRGSDSRHPEFRLSGPRIPVGQPLPARFGPMHDPRFVWQPLRHERRAVPVHFLRASWADV